MTTKETGLSFLEFCEAELIDLEAAAARGEPGMTEKAATLWRILETAAVGRAAMASAEKRPAPKHYGKARPSLADFDSAGEKWGNRNSVWRASSTRGPMPARLLHIMCIHDKYTINIELISNGLCKFGSIIILLTKTMHLRLGYENRECGAPGTKGPRII